MSMNRFIMLRILCLALFFVPTANGQNASNIDKLLGELEDSIASGRTGPGGDTTQAILRKLSSQRHVEIHRFAVEARASKKDWRYRCSKDKRCRYS